MDVPQCVIDNREHLRKQFIKWLFSPDVKPKYTVIHNGHRGVCYRSEAFAAFLNEKILCDSKEKAVVLEQYVSIKNIDNLPSVLF